jgi:hypothetical protein
MQEAEERLQRLPISLAEETHWLEDQLEKSKNDLRRDLIQIQRKLQQTGARLRPATFLGDKSELILGVAFALGFALGYWDVALKDLGKPVARAMLTTVGSRLALSVIKR